jgi:DNA-binding GntR family transcriptional regulator
MGARLVATRMPDLSDLDQTVADMYSAVQCGNIRSYCERDLAFHLLLREKSGNRFLLEHLRRLIVFFFAFRVLRHKEDIGDPERGCGDHRAILEAVRSGDPELAQREMVAMIRHFSRETVGLLSKRQESRTETSCVWT